MWFSKEERLRATSLIFVVKSMQRVRDYFGVGSELRKVTKEEVCASVDAPRWRRLGGIGFAVAGCALLGFDNWLETDLLVMGGLGL
jgi:hypothetical protein